ncbi:Molybdenum cofactor sulfurase [Tolypocladium ophioglossoides CBS 100239]|uniref:Molybdenum cofactor sulfurase n=1 Tax=Tolypocladium ophioglossoides (strain CBS 100239) TaxID=1163406 RepID=A0A0L0MYT3_TOLOC|nr:Molybdenum cofactor sulfurase [Tolypocladium ophioglossoides CBS 100239]
MTDILDSYPEYGMTTKLDELRAVEYSYLDEQCHVYMDYTGSGLAARAQYRAHAARLECTTFGNPHSINPTSQSATDLVEQTRKRVLAHFNASPEEYSVIFTANATGAARLVGEAYPFRRRSRLVLTSDNHNSVNGLREFARRANCRTHYVPIRAPDMRIDTATIAKALPVSKCSLFVRASGSRAGLFAYPAQSNFSGVQHPLGWVSLAQKRGYDVLLDAAAYLPTGTLDLSALKPEFVTVSWYKLFGFPTGVGCLIARRDALARLVRPWFSGGTIVAATVGIPWHMMVPDEGAFEDGTVNFLSIPDVHFGLDWLTGVGMELVRTRVRSLTGWFIDRLAMLRHSDDTPMAAIYGPTSLKSRGGTVSFNLLDAAGKVVDERIVAMESAAARISLRTGCFCNPGAGEVAFGIDTDALPPLGHPSFDEFLRIMNLPSAGAVRVSFGVASTAADVDYFFAFVENTYRDRVTTSDGLALRTGC